MAAFNESSPIENSPWNNQKVAARSIEGGLRSYSTIISGLWLWAAYCVRVVRLLYKSGQLIANQVWEFCYCYDAKNHAGTIYEIIANSKQSMNNSQCSIY